MPDTPLPQQSLKLLGDLSTDDQTVLAASITSDFRNWKQSRARLETRWRECWEAYLCDVKPLETEPEETSADRSRIARPVLYEAVEAIHANLLNALFPANEQFFTVLGKTETDHRNAQLIEEFIRNKLADSNFIEKYALFLKQAIITGNSVAAVPWRETRQTRRINQPVKLFGMTVGYEKATVETTIYNGPDFEVLDIFDVLLDPNATDFARAKLIRAVERSLTELQNNPAYRNLENLQSANNNTVNADEANKQGKRRAFGLDETLPNPQNNAPEKIKLLEAWGDFQIGETCYENYVCVVANGSTIIRFEPNPYDSGMKPFIFSSFIPVPNEIYGIGAIEKSLGLQHAINTLTNQKLDIINLSINAPFTYLINDDVFNPDALVTRPGALIPVKSHDTLRPIQFPNNFTVAFSEIADLKNEAQEATGALKYFTGGETAQQRTATEVGALLQGGRQKFSSFLSHLEQTSLEPFLRMVLENARQFLSGQENLRICGPDGSLQFLRIAPESLQGCEYQFRIEGTRGQLFKAEELQAITSFLRLVENSPALKEQVNWLALYKKIYRRLGFTDEAEIFIAAPNADAPDLQPKRGDSPNGDL